MRHTPTQTSTPPGAISPATINQDGKLCGYVHSVETGAAVDGPGMRFVAFLCGCQFKCLYCHNPDTWKLHNGKLRTVDDLVAEIGKYASFLKIAGGVTLSGGEPLLQAHFAHEILYRVKKQYGLHTAIDTQGFLAAHLDDDWFTPVDLILLDIKHINPQQHQRLTGQPLQPTLDFAQRLMRMRKKTWIRYVLVPGWSDNPQDIEKLAQYLQNLSRQAPGCIERVEILPFHQLGAHKWQTLGLNYELASTAAPSAQLVQQTKEQFKNKGLITN